MPSGTSSRRAPRSRGPQPGALPAPVLLAVLLPPRKGLRAGLRHLRDRAELLHTKVLSRFASTPGLRLTVSFEVPPESDVTRAQIEETRTALRELGLEENLEL